MRGLRTKEDDKFMRFFQIVQNEANKQNCVFFLDGADGNELIEPDMEISDLMGWLIPADQVGEFEKPWSARSKIPDRFDNCFLWAEWEMKDGQITISFNKYQ